MELTKEEFDMLLGLGGGIGCDLVTGTGTFTARKGKIYCAVANENDSGIQALTYDRNEIGAAALTLTAASGLSYLKTAATASFDTGAYILFDYPLRSIKLAKGSFVVYYRNN